MTPTDKARRLISKALEKGQVGLRELGRETGTNHQSIAQFLEGVQPDPDRLHLWLKHLGKSIKLGK